MTYSYRSRFNLGSHLFLAAVVGLAMAMSSRCLAQGLEAELLKEPTQSLVEDAVRLGDASRGAIVFYQPTSTCVQCHNTDDEQRLALGPDLGQLASAREGKSISEIELVEAILSPSKYIGKAYRGVIVATGDGENISGLVVEENDTILKLREATPTGRTFTLTKDYIEGVKENPLSLMPAGLVNSLQSRQQFLDLVKYLLEVRDGGRKRALELKPSAAMLVVRVPEYESHLDHAGLIGQWDDESLKRGEAIYTRVCANCHGTKDQPGSLPNSLRFAEGKFKNGSDPLSMYRTLTHGFGFMVAQTWMVPSQKYDVIHYIRERYLEPFNSTQYQAVDAAYLASLPKGDTFGPEASLIEAWVAMDYGPSLIHTYEVPGEKENFAYKGIAIRLDQGAGGVSRGKQWAIFDTDTLRIAATWRQGGKGVAPFIDWRGIQFNGEHQIHPTVSGDMRLTNSTGPGWGKPGGLSLADDARVMGRDSKRYGPLPKDWGRFRGLYHHDQKVILQYDVGDVSVLEYPTLQEPQKAESEPWYVRHFEISERSEDMLLRVMDTPTPTESNDNNQRWTFAGDNGLVATWLANEASQVDAAAGTEVADDKVKPVRFDGSRFVQIDECQGLNFGKQDFTIEARLKTKEDGSIFAWTEPGPKWVPNGEAWFIRDGKLCFDIGWVGAVAGRKRITDGAWHNVRITSSRKDGKVRMYVDGKLDGEGVLKPKDQLSGGVIRIGFAAENFPAESMFHGEIAEVRLYQRVLPAETKWKENEEGVPGRIGRWRTNEALNGTLENLEANGKETPLGVARVVDSGEAEEVAEARSWMLGVRGARQGLEWVEQNDMLCLRIPAGKGPLRFSILARAATDEPVQAGDEEIGLDLAAWTRGGPPRYVQTLTTDMQVGDETGAFAVDTLVAPQTNPWLALTRFTGLDFMSDGRMAVCTWDGDVWLVKVDEAAKKIQWKRIASGLFQPLGLKVVADTIFLTCRDQLTKLHDLNGDEEIDFYECFNNDHQVTEHFHEFAMGLQVDADGNFYYAKSGRHALKAVVPHHGTLLRVTPDGEETTILATGFRAANGVCLNPDGSFVVTDQEGFWNPKNRINWVTIPKDGTTKFYGNMFGYHDVTDSSDAAMEPPLCWITNEFDRSPAELLWVDSPSWGGLNGALLNLSYGYGRVFVVPHEEVAGNMQGGMISLPIPDFPTGVMRGRFSSTDGSLYLCGMFAWAGNATEPGGFYRLRATGKAMNLPVELHARKSGLQMRFTDEIDPTSLDPQNVQVKVWSLKRTANYGSEHYGEHALEVSEVRLSSDGKTVEIGLPEIAPTWCMEIRYQFRDRAGSVVSGVLHNTIHTLSGE